MSVQSIAPTQSQTQAPVTGEELQQRIQAEHAEQGTVSLYRSVRPLDGLDWDDLSDGQRERYRRIFEAARQTTDLAREWM